MVIYFVFLEKESAGEGGDRYWWNERRGYQLDSTGNSKRHEYDTSHHPLYRKRRWVHFFLFIWILTAGLTLWLHFQHTGYVLITQDQTQHKFIPNTHTDSFVSVCFSHIKIH